MTAFDISADERQQLTRLGAKTRLEELRREEARLLAAFPDIDDDLARIAQAIYHPPATTPTTPDELTPATSAPAPAKGRRRRANMSAAAREAVSRRMKKYWRDRRRERNSNGASAR